MLNETFYLDGVDARNFGIHLQSPIEFSEAVPVIEAQTIPGRNGDLIWETGSYENRSGLAECFCLQEDVEKAISVSGRFLTSKRGYRRLETSDDPDHFWLARVENSPQINQRLRRLSPFTIGFDCKPQRFLKSGEQPIVFSGTGALFNIYGQIALPLIVVEGSGSGSFTIGDFYVEIKEIGGMLFLDSDTQNAYNDEGGQNMNINAPVFPVLNNGKSNVEFSGGIVSLKVFPRWWEL